MKPGKKTITILIIFTVFLALVSAGFILYKNLKEPKAHPISAIPNTTAFFIKTSSLQEGLNLLLDNNTIWQTLAGIEKVKQFHDEVKKLRNHLYELSFLKEVSSENNIVFSFHYCGKDAFNFLMAAEMKTSFRKNAIDKLFLNVYGAAASKGKEYYKNRVIYKQTFISSGKTFFYTLHKGLFLGSFSNILLEQSLDQLDSRNNFTDNKTYRKLKTTEGKNVQANIYIHYAFYEKFFSRFFNTENKNTLDFISRFAGMTELDLIIKKDELLFNGYTTYSDSLGHFLSLFKKQKPQAIEITRIAPSSTSFMLFFGADNMQALRKDFVDYYQDNSMNLPDATEIAMTGIFKGEICLLYSQKGKRSQNVYAILKLNPEDGVDKLIRLTNRINSLNGQQSTTTRFKDIDIRNLGRPGLIKAFYGPVFSALQNNHYAIIENYAVFSDDPMNLMEFIDHYVSGRTLNRNMNYIEFNDNISEFSNIYLYHSIHQNNEIPEGLLKEEFLPSFRENLNCITTINSIGIQFSNKNDLFYTNLYLNHSDARAEEKLSLWEVTLDSLIHDRPYIAQDHRSGSNKLIVFDKAKNMYLLNEGGEIEWKTPLAELPVSSIHRIDYYNNGKYQYLFNTANYFYCIDLTGKLVADYPVKLKKKAGNGLQLLNYGEGKYRILIAGIDKIVYNYSKEGKIVEGWQNPAMPMNIIKPVQYMVFGNKDYILISDSIGDVKIVNRRGEERIRIKRAVNHSGNPFYPDENQQQFISSSYDGKIIEINTQGKITEKELPHSVQYPHSFLYRDFDGDDSKDYIFISRDGLIVFNQNLEIIKQSGETNLSLPELFSYPFKNDSDIFGYINNDSDVLLYHNNMPVSFTEPVRSDIPFIVISYFGNDTYNLVAGIKNQLKTYPLQN